MERLGLSGSTTCSPRSGETPIQVAIVDTGPLLAAVDRRDPHHARCSQQLQRTDLSLIVPVMAVAEATFMIQRRLGSAVESRFLAGITELEIEAPTTADWTRMAALVSQYEDLDLGGTDASIIALAERLEATTIVTLDQRHFSVVRPQHVESFELLPG